MGNIGLVRIAGAGLIWLSLSPAEQLVSQAQHCLQPRYPARTVQIPASQRGFPASQPFSVHPNGLIYIPILKFYQCSYFVR